MTPKEQAETLVEFFEQLDPTELFLELNPQRAFAKASAKKCVQQIEIAIDQVDELEVQNLDRVHAYWQKVIEAIDQVDQKF